MHSTHTKVVEFERMLSNQREIWTTSDDIGTLHPPHPSHPPFIVHYYVKQIPIRSQHHLMERHSICSKTWSLFQSTLLEACRSVQWKSQRKYPHVGLLYRCDWPRCNHNQFFFSSYSNDLCTFSPKPAFYTSLTKTSANVIKVWLLFLKHHQFSLFCTCISTTHPQLILHLYLEHYKLPTFHLSLSQRYDVLEKFLHPK